MAEELAEQAQTQRGGELAHLAGLLVEAAGHELRVFDVQGHLRERREDFSTGIKARLTVRSVIV